MAARARIVWCALALAACDDGARSDAPAASEAPPSRAFERAIENQLSVRVGRPITVWCGALPPRCRATLPDRSRLPIRLALTSEGWTWRVDGMLVASDPIEAYLRDTLADLGAVQKVSCLPQIRLLEPGGRIACELEHRGKAFVVVSGDGSFAVEIELDPIAAAARAGDAEVDLDRLPAGDRVDTRAGSDTGGEDHDDE